MYQNQDLVESSCNIQATFMHALLYAYTNVQSNK